MAVLNDFLVSYVHYTVSYRLWEDTCRQLRDCKGTLEERQQLVDESLRLAMCVIDNASDTEALLQETMKFLQKDDIGDLAGTIPLIDNSLMEDRARAEDYSMYITRSRMGIRTRKPRRPRVANPFIPLMEDGEQYDEAEDNTDDSEDGSEVLTEVTEDVPAGDIDDSEAEETDESPSVDTADSDQESEVSEEGPEGEESEPPVSEEPIEESSESEDSQPPIIEENPLVKESKDISARLSRIKNRRKRK